MARIAGLAAAAHFAPVAVYAGQAMDPMGGLESAYLPC